MFCTEKKVKVLHFHPFPDFGSGEIVISSLYSQPGHKPIYTPHLLWSIERPLLFFTPLSNFFSVLLSPFAAFQLFFADGRVPVVVHGRT